MESYGTYRIWLRGSRMTIRRAVYRTDDGKTVIKFYGQLIEVKPYNSGMDYYTVEMY